MFYKIDRNALCHFCEKLMIAGIIIVLKVAFAPRFASIRDFWTLRILFYNYAVILARF